MRKWSCGSESHTDEFESTEAPLAVSDNEIATKANMRLLEGS